MTSPVAYKWYIVLKTCSSIFALFCTNHLWYCNTAVAVSWGSHTMHSKILSMHAGTCNMIHGGSYQKCSSRYSMVSYLYCTKNSTVYSDSTWLTNCVAISSEGWREQWSGFHYTRPIWEKQVPCSGYQPGAKFDRPSVPDSHDTLPSIMLQWFVRNGIWKSARGVMLPDDMQSGSLVGFDR